MDENSSPSALPSHLLVALDEWLAWADPLPTADDCWPPDAPPPAPDEAWTSARRDVVCLLLVGSILLLLPLLLAGRVPF